MAQTGVKDQKQKNPDDKATKSTVISTNPEVHAVVDRIATELHTQADFHGLGPGAGDRGPHGQNLRSDHKKKNAQDFHMKGYSDIEVFAFLRANPGLLPPNTQVILHGSYSRPD